ncbi:NAD(P)H-dependent glycerol-3-phosphate dehydrogenase [bacterium]|nr:NAD(P)H-dependent glycerol-3-phosphate dehydrogenase [bacterium]
MTETVTQGDQQTISVIGAGAWGTALAIILAQNNHAVRLWEFFPDYAAILNDRRENPKFLPGIKIPETIRITSDLEKAVQDSRIVVMAVPSQVLRTVIRKIAGYGMPLDTIITASKGIEQTTLMRMSEVVKQECGLCRECCVLSGPSHAEEVSRQIPTSVVAAAKDVATGTFIQTLFSTEHFRVYSSQDVVGVELGGALKNVIAIAAGIVDGLGLGDNTKAALMTRGLAEMGRLGRALQAKPETFAGLSGMGDLVVTCTSQHSRNRRVGEELGRGRTLEEILNSMEMVAEGVETTKSAKRLADQKNVEMPIITEVYKILFEVKSPRIAVKDLMQRPRKTEMETGGKSGSEAIG